MKIYVHREGAYEPEAIEASPDTFVSELVDVEMSVAVIEDHDGQLDLTLSLAEAEIVDRSHVYVGKRHRVGVVVSYNGMERSHEFSSATRVERVFRWAVGPEGYNLGPADAIEHTLAICGTDDIPAPDVHIGSIAEDRPGHVCLALIPKHRYEG